MKKSLIRILSVLSLILLLLNPFLAAAGARSGLILWAQAVLPALLPFMICSNVIVALDAIPILMFPFRRLLSHLLYLSDAGCYVLVSGLLCGYPMGARTCSDFMDEGRISTKEGQYLFAICNHPSPMFLLGYVYALLPKDTPVLRMLIAVYLPILPLAAMAKRRYEITAPARDPDRQNGNRLNFDNTLIDSCGTIIKIGGYIMLFSILAAYVNRLPIPWQEGKAVLLSGIEITTGIQAVSSALPGSMGAMAICAACSFGGFSGIFQTKSVTKNAGLSIRHYIIWKGLHSILSCIVFILLAFLQQVL